MTTMSLDNTFMILILVDNYAGVLSQITRLFSRRGYNIQSITADKTQNPDETRITIIADGDQTAALQILLQLRKQISVLSAKLLDPEEAILRAMVIVKVDADTKEKRDEVIQISNIFRANIMYISVKMKTVDFVYVLLILIMIIDEIL